MLGTTKLGVLPKYTSSLFSTSLPVVAVNSLRPLTEEFCVACRSGWHWKEPSHVPQALFGCPYPL